MGRRERGHRTRVSGNEVTVPSELAKYFGVGSVATTLADHVLADE